VTHPRLAALAPAAQQREIADGKTQLEALLERPVVSFAYPYGHPWDYDAASVAAVRSLGFESACSNFPGRVERRTDRFQLPRFPVEGWDGDAFERHLTAAFDA
jgi:peptidoglycan/xylan/chitin deacetylase (PgdA/CDA1 family)